MLRVRVIEDNCNLCGAGLTSSEIITVNDLAYCEGRAPEAENMIELSEEYEFEGGEEWDE